MTDVALEAIAIGLGTQTGAVGLKPFFGRSPWLRGQLLSLTTDVTDVALRAIGIWLGTQTRTVGLKPFLAYAHSSVDNSSFATGLIDVALGAIRIWLGTHTGAVCLKPFFWQQPMAPWKTLIISNRRD